jgi:hypothetical protein
VARGRELLHRDPHTVLWRERDPSQNYRVRLITDGPKLDARYGDAQHLGHLGMGKRRADAAPYATAEG